MNIDDLFLDPQYKLLKKLNLSNYQETGENCQKCHVDEVDKLLSLKRILLKQLRYERCVSLSEAEWDEDLKLAKVTKIAKNLTKNYSHSYKGSIYLYPEECLCLLEMKCLILRWNERKLSIKNAYALLLQAGSGCTFEQFRTYGYLVKLGFRVFKYNNELKNNNYHKNDLTKVPEIPYKKKKDHVKKIRKFDSLICTPNNRESFPKLKSTGWVVISRPESCYLPHNILPNYDTYSFNIAVSSNSIKIIKVVPYYENMNLKKKKKFPKESMIYDSFLLTGNHPIYEKNILKTVKFDDTMYIPQIKKLKLNSLPITINMSSSSLSEERNLHPSKYEEKMKIEENSLTIINNTATVALTSNNNFYPSNIDEKMEIDKNYFPDCINMIASTLNNENNLCNITLKESHSVNINQKDLKDEVTEANSTFNLNFSSTVKSISSNKLEPTSSDTILEDETINKLLNLPST
ncbi:uncharacterized protein LOC112687240 isoform X2 [Sipha flava]|uniref:Uncharacterized protein LOC112687240 isoform X2 n=1 Tax=Sipha flava TaxID=143950 RepID=A0A8B8FZ45_9HEMI|nr:uncharacterized protein LOC112687240 isoform X2 [Sipha flava]